MGYGYNLGLRSSGSALSYKFQDVPNFNALFLGTSGSGKTHMLQKAIKHMPIRDGITVHIADTKDDFTYEGFVKNGLAHDLHEDMVHNIDFSYVGGNSGLNIFQFSLLETAGGVYMAVREIIEICGLFNPSFSPKMGTYLSLILKRCYRNRGITHSDQSSWSNTSPTLLDVVNEVDRVRSVLRGNANIEGSSFWKELARCVEDYPEEAKGALTPDAHKVVTDILLEGAVSNDDHYFRDWSQPTLASLRDTLSGMLDSQLFSRPVISRKLSRINRYRLTGVAKDHLKIIVRVLLNQTFNMAARQTYAEASHNCPVPKHIVVCDEAKYLNQIGRDEMSPHNRIVTEGRGYGMGLWAGVQSTRHVSSDFIKCSALKTVLKIEEAGYAEAIKDLGIPRKRLEMLIPKRNRWVDMGAGFELATG